MCLSWECLGNYGDRPPGILTNCLEDPRPLGRTVCGSQVALGLSSCAQDIVLTLVSRTRKADVNSEKETGDRVKAPENVV